MNVFIANTEFHLQTIKEIKKNLNKESENILIYISSNSLPAGYNDDYTYTFNLKKNIPFRYFYCIYFYARFLRKYKGVDLFVGNDFQIENQIIISLMQPRTMNGFDDGFASYNPIGKKRLSLKKIAMKFVYPFYVNNLRGVGQQKYDLFFTYSSKLCRVNSSNVREIEIAKEINHEESSGIFIATQPLSEFGIISIDDEIRLYKENSNFYLSLIDNDERYVFLKKHPAEEKLLFSIRAAALQSIFHDFHFTVIDESMTIDDFFSDQKKCISVVFSPYSSCLYYMLIKNQTKKSVSMFPKSFFETHKELYFLIDLFNDCDIKIS